MVTFVLHAQDDFKVVYYYYPENDRYKQAGVIEYKKTCKEISIKRCADIDWLTELTASEFNERANKINKKREAQGYTDFIKLATKTKLYPFYGTYVLEEIKSNIAHGIIPKEGRIA